MFRFMFFPLSADVTKVAHGNLHTSPMSASDF